MLSVINSTPLQYDCAKCTNVTKFTPHVSQKILFGFSSRLITFVHNDDDLPMIFSVKIDIKRFSL